MIVVHHLNDSRSQRILWLLEELGVSYEVKRYERDPATRFAPPELKAAHPLGKAPVVVDGDRTLHESGAIVDYLVRRYGDGRIAPSPTSESYDAYVQWLHYAEGSAMAPFLLIVYISRLGEAGAPLRSRIAAEMANHLGYIDQSLEGRDWLLDDFSAADVQLSFVGELARATGQTEQFRNIAAWVDRFELRPAYRRALQRGGPYAYAQS